MRVHLDDCDIQLPTIQDVLEDVKDLSPEVLETFWPSDMATFAELWIRLLQLSVKLDYAMVLHYRPRRPPLSIPQLETDYADTLRLLPGLELVGKQACRLLTLHVHHLRIYVNTVIIVLYRPYMLSKPEHLHAFERDNLQRGAIQACKTAAADMTNTVNKLVSDNMIETSPTQIVTSIMMAMQIHFFELAKSEGLLRQHALHNMNLHFMVYKHLKQTFWTADMHHNLFTECVKALNSGNDAGEYKQYAGYSASLADPNAGPSTPHLRDDQPPSNSNVLETSGMSESAFDEFFSSFGPFDNFPCLFDGR